MCIICARLAAYSFESNAAVGTCVCACTKEGRLIRFKTSCVRVHVCVWVPSPNQQHIVSSRQMQTEVPPQANAKKLNDILFTCYVCACVCLCACLIKCPRVWECVWECVCTRARVCMSTRSGSATYCLESAKPNRSASTSKCKYSVELTVSFDMSNLSRMFSAISAVMPLKVGKEINKHMSELLFFEMNEEENTSQVICVC